MEMEQAGRAMTKLGIPSEAKSLYTQYSALQRLGTKHRTPAQEARYQSLVPWAKSFSQTVAAYSGQEIPQETRDQMKNSAIGLGGANK
jgi:hypothetical protein